MATSAASVGFMACEALAGTPNGAGEAAIMVAVYVTLNMLTQRRVGWEPLLIGYFFAWVG